MTDATSLKDFATTRQREILAAIDLHGSQRQAGKALGLSPGTIGNTVKAVKRKAALQGFAPEADLTRLVPEPHVLRGVSSLYDGEGKLRLQWVKTKLDESKAREAIEEWVTWLVEDAAGKAPAIALSQPQAQDSDLLAVYPMGDPHFGMYAWAEEAGHDFDAAIAEQLTYAAIDRLVASAPPAKQALIIELGDFFHADNNNARTERAGNPLDTDTRHKRIMRIGLRAMTYVIQAALKKHEKVTVRIVQGNHDTQSSYALALGLDAWFRNEQRVEIDLSAAPFWYHRFGKVLIGATHGDTCKPGQLPSLMAADQPQEWGTTKHRYWYHGHVHHASLAEHPGCLVESFRTLAPRDAWATGAGYRAGRDMFCIVHHKDFGEIERHRCDIAMIEKRVA